MKNKLWSAVIIAFVALLWSACDTEEIKECSDSYTDERDGRVYCITTIGTQTWMAENLSFITDSSVLNPSNPSSVNAEYGRLYNFSEANSVCPTGWHLPTDDEWKTLEQFLGMNSGAVNATNLRGSTEGLSLKSVDGWDVSTDSTKGNNNTGFNALPAGEWNPSYGPYFNLGENATFWTSTVYDTTGGAWIRDLSFENGGITRSYFSQSMAFSCRCLKD